MQHLLNAVFVVATPEQVAELRSLPGVKGVVAVRRYQRKLNKATELVNAPAAWALLGGVGNAGLGVRIAILDTGIDNTHPAFQDPGLPMPPGFPVCPVPTDCQFTSNKVIVARSYVNQLGAGTGSDPSLDSRPDDASARDLVGHGTALASAAAGESTVAPYETIIGMAPRAYLGNYKLFGSDEINSFTDSAAIDPALEDAAMQDHMQVAVLSLGGPPFSGPIDNGPACGNAAGVPCDIDSATVANAIKAGMVVVIAAGNEGQIGQNSRVQTLSSVGTPGLAVDAITVGAISNSHIFDSSIQISGPNVPAALTYITEDMGSSIIPPGNLTGPLVDAAKVGEELACSAFPANAFAGAIAIVTRGTCLFSDKAQNVFAAGGIGMIVVNTSDFPAVMGGLEAAPIPAASIGASDGANLRTYLAANSGVSATIPPGMLEEPATPDQIASFSSIGPALGGGLKPEITAPGVSIYLATQSYDPLGGEFSANRYTVGDGTSFSTPLVAGGAALVIQKHPNFTPLQVKSALVNTAARPSDLGGNSVGTASTNYSVLETGAGRMDAGAALATNVTIEPSTLSFGALGTGPQKPLASLAVYQYRRGARHPLAIAVNRTVNDAATTLAVDKPSLTIAPGSSAVVNVTLTGTRPGFGDYEGSLEISGAAVPLHIPFFYGVPTNVPNDYFRYSGSGTGTAGQLLPNGVVLRVIDKYGFPVQNAPVTFAITSTSGATLVHTDATTNQFGVAHTDVLLGPTPCLDQLFEQSYGARRQPHAYVSPTTPARNRPSLPTVSLTPPALRPPVSFPAASSRFSGRRSLSFPMPTRSTSCRSRSTPCS